MFANVYVCAVAGMGGQMKEERLICPTTPKIVQHGERCLELNYKFTMRPAMAHTFCCALAFNLVLVVTDFQFIKIVRQPILSMSLVNFLFNSSIMSNVSRLNYKFLPLHSKTIEFIGVNILPWSHTESVIGQSSPLVCPFTFLSSLCECCRTNSQKYQCH
jgi:hypothetical protein